MKTLRHTLLFTSLLAIPFLLSAEDRPASQNSGFGPGLKRSVYNAPRKPSVPVSPSPVTPKNSEPEVSRQAPAPKPAATEKEKATQSKEKKAGATAAWMFLAGSDVY